MSRDINELTPQMQEKANKFLHLCSERGVNVLIYNTTRSLETQAKYYRQGRTYLQIKDKINKMKKRGFFFLAEIIESVGAQMSNKKITNAAPGESFHNIGEAFDAVPLDKNGKAIWNTKHGHWPIMLEVGELLGLNCGGNWKRFKDYPHFQLRGGSNPTRVYTPEALEKKLRDNNMLK